MGYLSSPGMGHVSYYLPITQVPTHLIDDIEGWVPLPATEGSE